MIRSWNFVPVGAAVKFFTQESLSKKRFRFVVAREHSISMTYRIVLDLQNLCRLFDVQNPLTFALTDDRMGAVLSKLG
jgi:hypothetical protein